jgi:hypothetical protein
VYVLTALSDGEADVEITVGSFSKSPSSFPSTVSVSPSEMSEIFPESPPVDPEAVIELLKNYESYPVASTVYETV